MILNKQELQCLFGICGKEEMARCGTTHPSRANLWCINMIFSTKYGSEHKKIIITNAPHQFINTTTNKSHPGSYKCNIHAAFCVDLNCTSISIYVFSRQLEHVCGSFNSMLQSRLHVMEGEAWALRATLNIVVNMGLTNVLYEMDNKSVVDN